MAVSVEDLLKQNIYYPDMLEALLYARGSSGNILKSHGLEYSVHLFLQLTQKKDR